jgi:hypothetical protein
MEIVLCLKEYYDVEIYVCTKKTWGYKNDFKNTYVVESWLIVYFKKEKHGELGGKLT